MNKLFMYGGVAVVVGVMAVAGNSMMAEDRAAAVAKFEITEAEFPMMDACEKAMRSDDIEFKSGVDEIAGCGCMTREIHDHVQKTETGLAAELLPALIAGAKTNGADNALIAADALFKKYHVTDARAQAVFGAAMDAVGKCSKPELYMTAEQRVQITEVKAKKVASSREALDEAVKRGLISREEADRRLASMEKSGR